jgi:hypothetical protein
VSFFNLQITQFTDGTATFAIDYSTYSCTFSGTLEQHGQLYSVPAAQAQCTDGSNPSVVTTELKATAQGVEGRFTASYGGSCRNVARFSGVLQ